MTVFTADEALKLSTDRLTTESVLQDITFAASKGGRSWTFAWMPPEVRTDLEKRGFKLETSPTNNFVCVTW